MKKEQSRRDFLRISAAGAMGALLVSNSACRNSAKKAKTAAQEAVDPKTFGIGLQLYTIRDAMASDPLSSLKQVSDTGYKYVELAGYSDG